MGKRGRSRDGQDLELVDEHRKMTMNGMLKMEKFKGEYNSTQKEPNGSFRTAKCNI